MNTEKESLVFGHYFVAFVDLLGQREKLKKFEALPSNQDDEKYKEFIALVKDTIGAVTDLQQTSKDFFTQFMRNEENSIFELIPTLHKFSKSEIKFQHFSDGLVIYVALKGDENGSPLTGVYAALAACGALCLLGLAKQRPVRIGIAIGIAAELRENELYGKAVAEAYEAESLNAQYPRVLVTDDVIEYLKGYANQKCAQGDLDCQMESQIAQASLKLLAADFDGRFIVNYLGEPFKKGLMEGSAENAGSEVYRAAYQFIAKELALHQEKQNTTLAFRYSLLHGYFFNYLGELKDIEKT